MVKINSPTRKSARVLDLTLYQKLTNLRSEIVAGFKVWLIQKDDTLHHSKPEWDELYKEYQNRTL